jgi:glycosyltransferase involved in cell wall biosynthesis
VNVLELYSSFLPKSGGVQRHMYDLCECLTRKGHNPIVLTWSPSTPPFEIIDGIRVHRIRVNKILSFARYPLILYLCLIVVRLSKKYKVDVVHAHDYLPGLAAVLAGVLLRKPVVTTFHLPIQKTSFFCPSRISPLFWIEKTLKHLFASWSFIICVSRFTYRKTRKLGFSTSKMKIILNWVTTSTKNVDSRQVLRKFNLEGKQYILSVGRLSEKQKHFSVLIHALRLLIAKGHKLDLVIVGNGPDQQAYENYSRKCNVKQNVHLLTAVSDIDLKTVYENCEFFVLPSCFEGLPLVLLEAMSYGKPSITTNVGGVCEVIENGFNGIIVNPSFDNGYLEIEKLLLAPHTKNMLGEKSRQTVMKRFSERNCKATVSFLENISNTIDDR